MKAGQTAGRTGAGRPASTGTSAAQEEAGAPKPDFDGVYQSIKALITEGTLRSGAAVSQLQLTRMLGVSRTPIREALRRLQAEGLLEAERNRRMRVTAIKPDELDSAYATRIFLESMGVALTVPHMTADDLAELQTASRAIDWDRALDDLQAQDRHLSHFKLLAMKHAGEGVRAAVAQQFDRCERVRKIYQMVSPGSVAVSRDEHLALLDAYLRGATDDAVFVASRHLGRTALAVLGYMAPDYEPRAVRYALAQTGRAVSAQGTGPVLNVIGNGPVRRGAVRNATRNKASGE